MVREFRLVRFRIYTPNLCATAVLNGRWYAIEVAELVALLTIAQFVDSLGQRRSA